MNAPRTGVWTRWLLVAWLCSQVASAAAQPVPAILLPKPQTEGGKPLMQALRERKTSREIGSKKLTQQQLSNLLWAAFGINRPENGHRTAPSAMNAQEIDLYVATADGLYQYDATGNQLLLIHRRDIRSQTGGQDFAKEAPVTIIFVADYARMVRAQPTQKDFYAWVDAGCISQNVYLFCASEGLATVVHDLDRPALASALDLRSDQKIVLAQAVGYPKAPDPGSAAPPPGGKP